MRRSAVALLASALVSTGACGGRSRETVITPASDTPSCDDVILCLVEFCAPTLQDALKASNWPASALPHATTYAQCNDGTSRFEQPGYDSGYVVAYDARGEVSYAALWPPADRPVCGSAPSADAACKECLITAHLPSAGGTDTSPPPDAGTSSVPPCEIDVNGWLVMPP
jgi:hypothetical protein